MNNLKLLDFSKGIRDKEVMYNFEFLYDLISRERLVTAGYGFLEGLKINYLYPDNMKMRFKFHMEEGKYVNKKGEETYHPARDFHMEYFNTVLVEEDVKEIDKGNIVIKDYPYVKNSWQLIENDKDQMNDNNILLVSGKKKIPIKNINGRTIMIDSRESSKDMKIYYYTAQERYDILTFDLDNNIRYHKGIESNSSTFYETYEDELILAIIRYIPHRYPDIKEAIIEIIQMEDISKRKIWIDVKNDKLYICGKEFDGTQFISMVEPKDPHDNQLWYDFATNQLKIWREVRGVKKWVVISDHSFMDVRRTKMWTPEELPEDMRTFVFDFDKEVDMIYPADTNSLEIIIDNAPLMKDQYTELTLQNMNEMPAYIRKHIPEKILNMKDVSKMPDYHNQGFGFVLSKPLVQTAHVEAIVNHTKKSSIPETRFERSSVFIDEQRLPVTTDSNIFKTKTKFLKDANQLEVFLNGIKLENKIHYNEIEIIDSDGIIKNYCDTFELFGVDLKASDRLVYKVTGNIMSYDDLSMYMEDVFDFYQNFDNENEEMKKEISEIKSIMRENYSDLNRDIITLKKENKELNEKLKDYLQIKTFINSLDGRLVRMESIDDKISSSMIEGMKATGIYTHTISTEFENLVLTLTSILANEDEEKRIDLILGKDYIMDKNEIIFMNSAIIDNSIEIYVSGIAYQFKGVEVDD